MDWIKLVALGSGMGLYIIGSAILKAMRGKETEPQESAPSRTEIGVKKPSPDATLPPALPAVALATQESPPALPEKSVKETAIDVPSKDGEEKHEAPVEAIEKPETAVSPKESRDTEAAPAAVPVESAALEEPTDAQDAIEEVPAAKKEDEAESVPESERKKQWFLIRSSSGQIRAIQAWKSTPKTIAGPFSSKEEANAAKKR